MNAATKALLLDGAAALREAAPLLGTPLKQIGAAALAKRLELAAMERR